MTYRVGNGKFVKRDNPCAIAAIVNARIARQRTAGQGTEQDEPATPTRLVYSTETRRAA